MPIKGAALRALGRQAAREYRNGVDRDKVYPDAVRVLRGRHTAFTRSLGGLSASRETHASVHTAHIEGLNAATALAAQRGGFIMPNPDMSLTIHDGVYLASLDTLVEQVLDSYLHTATQTLMRLAGDGATKEAILQRHSDLVNAVLTV